MGNMPVGFCLMIFSYVNSNINISYYNVWFFLTTQYLSAQINISTYMAIV